MREGLEAGSGFRVLVVEDDPPVLHLISRILGLGNHEVFTAGNWQEAFRIVGERGPLDLLVTDVTLPGMSGRELALRLRCHQPDLAILLVSGQELEAGELEAFGPGTSFLLKPFTPQELLSAVEATLADRTPAPPPGPGGLRRPRADPGGCHGDLTGP